MLEFVEDRTPKEMQGRNESQRRNISNRRSGIRRGPRAREEIKTMLEKIEKKMKKEECGDYSKRKL